MKKNNPPLSFTFVAYQEELRRELPLIKGCKDYQELQYLLVRIDDLLKTSGLDSLFMQKSLELYELRSREKGVTPKIFQIQKFERHTRRALRTNVLQRLLGCSFREMSSRLAQCELFRWFCQIREYEEVRVPGKSLLEIYSKWIGQEEMEEMLKKLTQSASQLDDKGESAIGLQNELELTTLWLDSTALKANIHYPVDWLLLRDGTRTLLKAILRIREHGLRRRIKAPEAFISQINSYCIAMSQSRRKAESKKERKRIFRQLKKLTQVIEKHGRRYREELNIRWKEETDLSWGQVQVILKRMDSVLEKLPQAREQAHERIIGERKVRSEEKMLSLYEEDIKVIVRGKSGVEVEFGNELMIGEQSEGYIVDHKLYKEKSKGDENNFEERLEKIKSKCQGKLQGVVGDRKFDSKKNRERIEKEGLYNGLAPRNSESLKERMREDEVFVGCQKRRAQTEGRVGILKNVFLEGIPRAKGFKNRELMVSWAVLTHNLWVLARMPKKKAKDPPLALAA